MIELSSKSLDIFLGGKQILDNINIHIKNKEFVGIIGPNGSGKSTFLKCLYRTLKPEKGMVFINDQNIENLPIKETAKKIAVVAQHNDLDFDFTVIDMVLIGRSPHKKFLERDTLKDYEIALSALEKVGMVSFKERSFNSLSGGEKQRIVLARALAQRTRCLILDEPTNHLDIKYQLQFMAIAKAIDVTIVSAIHDLNLAALYCDKLYALGEGSLIKYGTPTEVLSESLIKDLYGVDAEINLDQKGRINIIYNPF